MLFTLMSLNVGDAHAVLDHPDAVGVRDAQMIGLGRRRRIPIEGMTIHSLAELIAGCAWPAIARFKDVRDDLAIQRVPFLPSRD